MNLLKSDNIVAVERMWGFEDTHYGAITLRLESGLRVMFKVIHLFFIFLCNKL